MADIIRLLPDSVANQIAAGEVIQRPASIVKELVENSVDAQATEIQVHISDAGKTMVQVIDNGKGMSELDARLSFERHATSKISQATDLYALSTMGFRGEALASIAAVAQVELKTKTKDMEVGVLLELEHSKVIEQRPVVCPTGAIFTIRNLFFNVPVRRKFLKTDATEMRHIIETFERIVLVNPQITFSLYHNKEEIFNLPIVSIKRRIAQIFGKRLEQTLLPVQVETTLINITGFVSSIQHSVKKGAYQFFFVNNRYMRHPYFQKAVLAAYEHLIPEGEQPHFFLYFQVNPSQIDVNIHPTKTEIKFENEQSIWQIILASVKETLGKFCSMPTLNFDTVEGLPSIPAFQPTGKEKALHIPKNLSFNPFKNSSENKQDTFLQQEQEILPFQESSQTYLNEEFIPTLSLENKNLLSQLNWDCLQFQGRFILTTIHEGLLIVDQQQAHIRILYDNFYQICKKEKSISLGLIFPEQLALTQSQHILFKQMYNDLQHLGFDFSYLGDTHYAIQSIPAELEGVSPAEIILSLLETTKEKSSDIKDEIYHLLALTLAQKTAISIGQYLTIEEMQDLIRKLFQLETPHLSPNGKVVFRILPPQQITTLFH